MKNVVILPLQIRYIFTLFCTASMRLAFIKYYNTILGRPTGEELISKKAIQSTTGLGRIKGNPLCGKQYIVNVFLNIRT